MAQSTRGALSNSPVAIGDVIAGKYRIEWFLGQGAMGLVVAATQLALDRLVAVKILSGRAGSDEVLTGRFMREARAAGRLQSDHVAKVIDVGTLPSGTPFMVMEHLEGADLAQVLAARGRFDVGTACHYVAQACEGVAEAHARGIVHRDLKPDNLYVTTGVGGEVVVKVLDFGVSKVFSVDAKLTTTSSIVGSPVYMAPEQMRGSKDVDARSDVWSLGVVLYELLTQRCPFEADSLPELCTRVVSEPPVPIESLRDDLPAGLVAVIGRCFEKDIAKRYANAGELAEALEPFADRARADDTTGRRAASAFVTTAPGPVGERRARRIPRPAWLAAALGVGLLAAGAGRYAQRPAADFTASAAARASSSFVELAPNSVGGPSVPIVEASTAPTASVTVAPAKRAERRPAPRPAAPRPVVDDIPAFR